MLNVITSIGSLGCAATGAAAAAVGVGAWASGDGLATSRAISGTSAIIRIFYVRRRPPRDRRSVPHSGLGRPPGAPGASVDSEALLRDCASFQRVDSWTHRTRAGGWHRHAI